MMKILHMECSNVSFLASDLLLDLSTFNQFFMFVWVCVCEIDSVAQRQLLIESIENQTERDNKRN